MQVFRNLNSPLQYLDTINEVEVWLKRDDLIHPIVSGNKWRKLKYYLQDFRESGKKVVLTFGGAFSNHLVATAAMGKMAGIPTKALVRGDEVLSNPTLDFCREHGMELEGIPRKRYATKGEPEFLQMLEETLPEVYVIPEGGKGPLGVKGCTEIMDEVDVGFDIVCAAAGTGTTVAGLLLGNYPADFWCFPALKGGSFLRRAIAEQVHDFNLEFSTKLDEKLLVGQRLTMRENYHFGGYAKITAELVGFLNSFYAAYQVPLDPVYTGKMMFGIFEEIKSGRIKPGSRLLAVHTGGLQGIKGMNARLKKSGKACIRYEDEIIT